MNISKNENVLPRMKRDRRILANVPDPENIRTNTDRRVKSESKGSSARFAKYAGMRYESEFAVSLSYKKASGIIYMNGACVDISQSGMQITLSEEDCAVLKNLGVDIGNIVFTLRFRIMPGAMNEGMEKRVKIKAVAVRFDNENKKLALRFSEQLYLFFRRRNDRYMFTTSAFVLFLVTAIIFLLRFESILYLRFTTILSVYSIITATFLLTRYFFGSMYRSTPVDPTFTPGVTIVIPCFNEEKWIERTILSCVDQDYPVDKLEIIIVDDCSTDKSVRIIQDTVERIHRESERYQTESRVIFIKQDQNLGKRGVLAAGVMRSTKELVAFVDSDSFLEPDAIRNLVQPFFDPKVCGVSGRTDVANTFTNSLTKMQAVRYYIAFRMMKAAESLFDSVLCLSGPLSCYRRQSVVDVMDKWLNQKFLGRKATFGDDRALTHMIVRNHRTVYQDTAICSTVVPHDMDTLLKQQMRWKRSWLRESINAARFMWRKEPFMALSFYMGLIVPVLAPVIVIYNLVYVPIAMRLFPSTFLMGILCMALLMSFVQLLMRKSSLWMYGLWFCFFYVGVLLWQMPWAWVTFWYSSWGTRMTPADLARKNKNGH